MSKVISADGTPIAFERTGQGPAVILVASALADRSDAAKLAGLLAERFTVINYDRRGRGDSGDTSPYAVEREVEDLDALIQAAGGSASVFGSSSGAVLALRAAASGLNITRLAVYEPPFRVDGEPLPAGFQVQLEQLLGAGRRGDASSASCAPKWVSRP
jgi:pimeloyl-ACP methyl ester carboxylesterase